MLSINVINSWSSGSDVLAEDRLEARTNRQGGPAQCSGKVYCRCLFTITILVVWLN